MIKQKVVLEVKVDDRIYEMSCSQDSPLGELHDVLMKMKGYTVDRMIAAQKEEQAIADAQKNDECCA